MKTRLLLLVVSLFAISLVAPIHASAAPKAVKADEDTATDEKNHKKNTTVLTLAAPADKVHAAALEALAAVGCTVKKDTPALIEGKRANKIGLAVGSGGEKLFVNIKDLGDGKTELTVRTKKTMAGIVGQKLWNEEVAHHIRDAVK